MELDYEKLGLKCGLEIHQQLDTKKLFCNCPSVLRKDEPDFEIKRKLHAVAGESGEIDKAAKYQASLDKEFIYQGYDTTCLVELDEEPPHEINKEALKIALQVAVLLKAKIFPLTQIMRKTVIDGSNTSGFQRTVLIARDGYVETEQGRVGVESICLEEDSARKIMSSTTNLSSDLQEEDVARKMKEEDNKVYFRLDRLGIPLVEIATAPDIKSPEQAKEVALYLGDVLRSCKVKRGIGTIREDVNVSIRGENRVELKGVQNMKMFLRIVENEVKRQLELSDKGKATESEVRNALPDGTSEFIRPMPGAARMYPETDLPLLKISRNFINDVKKTLPDLKSEIEKELQKTGLHKEMIKLLFKQNKIEEFKQLLNIINKPQLIAKTLLIFPKEIASHKKIKLSKVEDKIEDSLADVLRLVSKGKLLESQIKNVLEKIVDGETLDSIKIERVDMGNVEEKIMKIIKDKPGLSEKAYMGLVMKEFRGKIDGREAMGIIGKYLR